MSEKSLLCRELAVTVSLPEITEVGLFCSEGCAGVAAARGMLQMESRRSPPAPPDRDDEILSRLAVVEQRYPLVPGSLHWISCDSDPAAQLLLVRQHGRRRMGMLPFQGRP